MFVPFLDSWKMLISININNFLRTSNTIYLNFLKDNIESKQLDKRINIKDIIKSKIKKYDFKNIIDKKLLEQIKKLII